MTGRPTFDVACAADESYVPHSAALLHSLIERTPEGTVQVHYLHGPLLSRISRDQLQRMVEGMGARITFIQVEDEKVALLAGHGHQTSPTWYRIFLPDLLPNVDRLLYLDCDVIALDSIAPLWELDLTNYYVGAVTNIFEPWYLDRIEVLGLNSTDDYFNAGVLLMNLDLMRRDGCARGLEDYAVRNHDKLMWVDQDTLVVVLGKRRLALDPRWNCMNSLHDFPWSADVFGTEAVAAATAHPALRHFEGPPICKPWHYLCQKANSEAYFAHRRQTPWPRTRIEGRTAREVIRRYLRRRNQPSGLCSTR